MDHRQRSARPRAADAVNIPPYPVILVDSVVFFTRRSTEKLKTSNERSS
jgi:hypothetical protein